MLLYNNKVTLIIFTHENCYLKETKCEIKIILNNLYYFIFLILSRRKYIRKYRHRISELYKRRHYYSFSSCITLLHAKNSPSEQENNLNLKTYMSLLILYSLQIQCHLNLVYF